MKDLSEEVKKKMVAHRVAGGDNELLCACDGSTFSEKG